jgi:hypothetical protein
MDRNGDGGDKLCRAWARPIAPIATFSGADRPTIAFARAIGGNAPRGRRRAVATVGPPPLAGMAARFVE